MLSKIKAVREKIRAFLPYMRYVEPARLKAIYVGLVAIAATNGITFSPAVDSAVDDTIRWVGAAFAVVALLQGEVTRRVVTSPATAAAIESGAVAPLADAATEESDEDGLDPETEAEALAGLPAGAGVHGADDNADGAL